MTKRARPLVLAAPSGTGKTTIAHRLVDEHDDFVFSISATTRTPRPGESDGVDYRFVSPERFDEMIRGDEFAEWAEVHGNMYGTPTANLEAASERGETVVLDIDVQGAAQIQATMPDVTLVFVLPPDAPTMLDRITKRGTESEDEVKRRLRSALEELARVYEFERVVVNDDLDTAVADVEAMARGEEAGRRPFDESARIDALRRDLAEALRVRLQPDVEDAPESGAT
jgi:guanylate kinase